jgi:hypothetical protein
LAMTSLINVSDLDSRMPTFIWYAASFNKLEAK